MTNGNIEPSTRVPDVPVSSLKAIFGSRNTNASKPSRDLTVSVCLRGHFGKTSMG